MNALQGKAVVVTGSGRGIGAAVAKLAAAEGASVVVNDVDADVAEGTVREITQAGGKAMAHACDIATWKGAEGLIQACVDKYGKIDGLVNNAGLFSLAQVHETTEADFRKLFDVNVFGTAFTTRHAAPHMMRRKSGAIVNVSSGAHMGLPMMTIYGGTKGAVSSFTYTWSLELKEHGIRVNALSPLAATRMAQISQDYAKSKGIPSQGSVSPGPEVNAPVVVFLLSDLAAGVTGQIVRIEGKQLSLVSHPGVALPTLERAAGWDVASIAEAFKSDLGKRQFPVGIAGLKVEVAGSGSAYWNREPS